MDVDTEIGLRNFEGVMAARSLLKDAVTIQIVAFPQSGVVTRPGTADLLDRAVRDGAELIEAASIRLASTATRPGSSTSSSVSPAGTARGWTSTSTTGASSAPRRR